MQFKSIVLSLTILSTVFVNAAPAPEIESGSAAGGVGFLLGSLLASSGSVEHDSINSGAKDNFGATINAPIKNADIGKNLNANIQPQLNVPLLSKSDSEIVGSKQKITEDSRRGDVINEDC